MWTCLGSPEFVVLLTLYHKTPTFSDKRKNLLKILRENEKMLVDLLSIFSFPKTSFKIWVTCIVLSSHAFILLVQTLTLSQTTNFRLIQIERVCRRQFQFYWKWQEALQTGRKNYGKRRNCSLWAISSFATVFSKGLYCKHIKTRACLIKG